MHGEFNAWRVTCTYRELHVLRVTQAAGGNGTAGTTGTAMAVPVFEREKWRCFDSNLTCVIECPLQALCRSLGCLRGL